MLSYFIYFEGTSTSTGVAQTNGKEIEQIEVVVG
jgi:hypothetical protein